MSTNLARRGRRILLAVTGQAGRLRLATAGVAAVEFSMILPVMILLYFGLTEVTPAINIKRKLTLVSRTLADLSSRSGTLSKDELKNIFSASTAIMRPYDDTGKTQMVVASIAVSVKNGTYSGRVAWSCGWNLKSPAAGDDLQALKAGDPYTVPAGFQNDTTKSFIVANTLFPYSPVIGQNIFGTISLKEWTPWPIRDADSVADPGCPTKT